MPDFLGLPRNDDVVPSDLLALQRVEGGPGSTFSASLEVIMRAVKQQQNRRRMLLESTSPNFDTLVYLWRYFTDTGGRADEYDLYVPFGDGRYAVYGFRGVHGVNGFVTSSAVGNFGRIREGVVGVNAHHSTANKTGSWTTVNEARVYGGSYTRSSTAGDTISCSVVGHTAFVRILKLSNGGFGIVSIDGDATRATLLPQVTLEDVDNGRFSANDIGKRYIECFANTSYYDEHILLAENLTDETHEITITVTGTKRATSTDFRVYISSIAASSLGDSLADENGSMLYVRDIHNYYTQFSALTTVVNFSPTGKSPEWMGENHGNELQVSANWRKEDGSLIELGNNEYASSREIYLERVTHLLHSQTGDTVHARKRTCFSARADRSMQLLAAYNYCWFTAGVVNTFYGGMCNVSRLAYIASPKTYESEFDKALLGDSTVLTFSELEENEFHGRVREDFFAAFSQNHDTVVVCYQPRVDLSLGNWHTASPHYAFLNRRDDGTFKHYFSRVSQTNSEPINPGSRHDGVVGWRVFRLVGASNLLGV